MTIYELLRKLIYGGSWTEEERGAALDLLERLEANNVLGTRASELMTKEE